MQNDPDSIGFYAHKIGHTAIGNVRGSKRSVKKGQYGLNPGR